MPPARRALLLGRQQVAGQQIARWRVAGFEVNARREPCGERVAVGDRRAQRKRPAIERSPRERVGEGLRKHAEQRISARRAPDADLILVQRWSCHDVLD